MMDKEGATVLGHYLLVDNNSGRVVRQTFTGIDAAKQPAMGNGGGSGSELSGNSLRKWHRGAYRVSRLGRPTTFWLKAKYGVWWHGDYPREILG